MYTNGETIEEQRTMAAIQSINQKVPELELRDLFAMHVLNGLVSGGINSNANLEYVAQTSYKLADAMLKAGRPQWHDLEKAPNDLPPKMVSNHNFSIEVLSDKGELVCYNFHYCEWFYWRSGKPIAWCEIPTFDKE